VFRLLPWREELLDGLLGADLVGFHTYDYARHFLSSVRRIMSAEHNMANVKYDNRMIKVDAFPMGIDYDKYAGSSETEEIQQEMQEVRRQAGERRLVLSVDRLDYSKGIPLRLRAFHEFLRNYPEFHGKVSLIMIVAPSRTRVPHYMELKREIDERVSSTNGEFGSIGWTPISYFYRPVPFEQLTAIYAESDVLLVTPLRDGMNLISKEYIAARKDMKGVVVLSETAGSARELGEALAVNPNNVSQIADRIYEALQMPEERQVEKNERMHARLKRYDVHYWADDFMDKLRTMSELQESFRVKRLSKTTRRKLFDDFKQSSKRLFFIDYDGTLITYGESPGVPDEATMESLRTLAQDPRNEVVIISGRQKEFLEERFSGVPIGIIAGHGIWLRDRDGQWGKTAPVTATWKDAIRPVLELYRDRTPGSRVEEHQYSLEWHYGRAEPELATLRRSELMDALLSLTSNHDLSVLEGNKLLEIKNSNVSKGAAAHEWVTRQDWDFVLAIGDDWTDNEVFSTIPDHGYSIKVGIDISSADYFLDSVEMVRLLIGELSRYVDT
jgi:trehalose 6-phosphate synthase/phosphatase